VASAALHLPGITDSVLPGWSIAVAQIVVGTAIGCRFAGAAVRTVGRVLALAMGSLVILLLIAGLITFAANALTGLDPRILVLAYAPGGMAEMALVALALGLDPALVTTHHVARIFLVVLLIPLAYRLARPRARTP
jgi:membrane AbrB-like protein